MGHPTETGRVRAHAASLPLPIGPDRLAGGADRAAAASTGTDRPEAHPRRDIVDAILYVARAGGSWRQLPVDYPLWQTVYWHFARWEQEGVTPVVHDVLRAQLRVANGHQVEPTVGTVDAQSV